MPQLYIPKLRPHSCRRNFLFNVFSWSGNIPRASKIQVNVTKKDNHVSMSWLLNLDTVEFFFWLKTNNCFIFSSAPLHETFGRGGALKLPSIFQVGLLFKKKKKKKKKAKQRKFWAGKWVIFTQNCRSIFIFKKKCLNTVLKTWHPILDSWNHLVKKYMVRRAGFQSWSVYLALTSTVQLKWPI